MNIDALRDLPPNKALWDSGKASVKGLHARHKGAFIGFYFYYITRSGKQRRPKIGTFPETSLAEARRRAKVLSDRVAAGEDPKGHWDETKGELTIQELFELTRQGHWSSRRVCTEKWAQHCAAHYRNHIEPTFGADRLSEVTVARLRSWMKRMEETPRVANVSLRVLSTMFNYAISEEKIEQGRNPCALVATFPEKKRKRYATAEELQALARVLEKYRAQYPAPVAFFYILMFSGARPISIEKARRDQLTRMEIAGQVYGVLKFQGKTSAETGEEEVVVLPPQAMAIIDSLPVPQNGTLLGCKFPKKLWPRLREESGIGADLWARDLRRTYATQGLSGGEGMGVIAELLNHRSTQTTKIYAKLHEDKRIEAAGRIANKIASIIEKKVPKESDAPSVDLTLKPNVVDKQGETGPIATLSPESIV